MQINDPFLDAMREEIRKRVIEEFSSTKMYNKDGFIEEMVDERMRKIAKKLVQKYYHQEGGYHI